MTTGRKMMFWLDKFSNNNQGQALILIMIVMALSLTIGSAIFINSLREYRVTSYTSQYSMAESAAEAGLEAALADEDGWLTGVFGSIPVSGGRGWGAWGTGDNKYSLSPVGVGSGYVSAKIVEQNEVIEIRVGDVTGCESDGSVTSAYNYTGDIDIFWNDCSAVDVEVLIYKIDCGVVTFGVYLDKRIEGGGGPGDTIDGVGFNCQSNSIAIDGIDTDGRVDEIVRIRPIGGGTKIAIKADGSLPVAQAVRVTAAGRFGQVHAEIEEEVTRPFLPPIFDYLMFSGGTITKN